jgi:hypothetical protein
MNVWADFDDRLDTPYWVRRDDFCSYFNQADFLDRDVIEVKEAYLVAWFSHDADGKLRFKIPVVSAIGRQTDLVGTRHRLAVILPHLAELPFAFARTVTSAEGRQCLARIPKRTLDAHEPFWIPDFPVVKTLP